MVLTCLAIGGHSHHATPLAVRCTNCQVTAVTNTTTTTSADCLQHNLITPCSLISHCQYKRCSSLTARLGWLHALVVVCVVDIVCVRRQCLQKRQCAFCCLSATLAALQRRRNSGQGPHCRRVYDCAHTYARPYEHTQCALVRARACVCVCKVSLLIFFNHSKSARHKRQPANVARNVHRRVFVKGQAVHWPWVRSISIASMLVLLCCCLCSVPAYDCTSNQQQVQHRKLCLCACVYVRPAVWCSHQLLCLSTGSSLNFC